MKFKSLPAIAFLLTVQSFTYLPLPHFETTPNSPIHITREGKLIYKADSGGNRVPDFSYCGYKASESPLPDVPVKIIVSPPPGDATGMIQQAIDYVSSLLPGKDGFRGTVLLEKGRYLIEGSLNINVSGVVLRGSGPGTDGTLLVAAGTDRETLIKIAGKNDLRTEKSQPLADSYFPVNSKVLRFKDGHNFNAGDRIIITRPSSKEWIENIGADKIGIYVDYTLTKWEPGDFDIKWFRSVVSASADSVVLDAPLTNSIDPQFGGGYASKYTWDNLISNVGVENIKCISTWDNSNIKDENHRWMAVTIENAADSWVRRLVAENFVSSAVAVWETARRITVEDCKSLNPIGEIGNYRRYSFQTLGQQVLFQRCYAEYGYHAFSVGFTAPGPNAFVQCYSFMPYNFSGATGGWATGILFDKFTVDGGNISFGFRDVDGQGGGWSAANSLCWQCRAAQIHLPAPPGAQNWAYGSWAQGYGNGHHELQHTFILNPESIYYAQLEARTGKKSPETEKILIYKSEETTAPDYEYSGKMSERSKSPDLTMEKWIDMMIGKYPLINDLSRAKRFDEAGIKPLPGKGIQVKPVSVKSGWIVMDNKIMTGRKDRTSLWRGTTRPSELRNPAPNLVRFVPGRTGRGLTDNLDTLVGDMLKRNVIAMQNYPSLWYERRRDDHARTRRANADVWTPFYEQPFSRSGQGEAFDRLSRYDLTKWNSWYWLRLKKFADLADQNGLLFIQEHYLQHNIIEEGAHWADYPWRTANNINNPGFPENPAYAGDKRIYMAEQFYDTTNAVLKSLHRNYIRKSLETFRNNGNIIHHLGMEFSGPTHFADFWLDVIGEWEKENNRDVLVMLPGTKDVQDAVLSDPKRSKLVDIIDVILWQYRKDGTIYAPIGGVSLAPRQYERIMEVGETSFDQIYRAVNELRTKYPDKAVVYSRRGVRFSDWAVFMAGGSLVTLPVIKDPAFLADAAEMSAIKINIPGNKQYVMGKKGTGYIFFSETENFTVDLEGDRNNYTLVWIDPQTGETVVTRTRISGGSKTDLTAPFNGAAVAWLRKK